MHWEDRIDNYVRETGFPRSLFIAEGGCVVGTWIMGNSYHVRSGYYGGYPAGYLRRIRALFPDKRRVLHLFSGRVDLKALAGDTVDINAELEPTYVDDAQRLERVPLDAYDLVLADPPYSVEDAQRYQTSMTGLCAPCSECGRERTLCGLTRLTCNIARPHSEWRPRSVC